MVFGLVVEGFGEVEAAPVLIRRIAAWLAPDAYLDIRPPFRTKRQKIVKPGELERVVELMARAVGPDGSLLVLLDADFDCPRDLGPSLLARARNARPDRPVAVVLAKPEFEAWFIAGIASLRGVRTISDQVQIPPDPEAVLGAKGWLDRQMSSGYAETVDQAALAARLDLNLARRADSFDKLVRDLARLLHVKCPPRSGS